MLKTTIGQLVGLAEPEGAAVHDLIAVHQRILEGQLAE